MAQVWEKENKKILDLKLLLYEEHPGWHESMVLSVSHDSAVETVGLFKTAERNPEKRLECETHSSGPFTRKPSDNSLWQQNWSTQ